MASDVNITLQNGSDAITTISMGVAAAATGLAQAQAVGAAGNLNLNGALIVAGAYAGTAFIPPGNTKAFYTPRRMVVVSTDAGDTTQTVTFTGTDRDGNALVESVTLNGVTTVTTTQDFATVTQIAISAATAGNVSAGTSAVASGAWIVIDRAQNDPISYQLRGTLVSGAATFGIEETMDDPNGNQDGTLFPRATVNGASVGTNYPPLAFADATFTAKAASFNSTLAAPFWAFRLTVTAGTGVVQLQALAALAPRR